MSLLALLLGACVSTDSSSRGRPAPSSSWERQLLALEQKGEPQALLAFVDARLAGMTSRSQRARLHLGRARALAAQDRPLSARTACQAAWNDLERREGLLAADILLTWGDVEVLSDHLDAARRRYEQALRLEGLPREDRQRLLGRSAVVAEALGDRAALEAARGELGLAGGVAMAEARRVLSLPSRRKAAPAPRVAAAARAPGLIPIDPRVLLAGIHTRSEWGARASGSNVDVMTPITAITVHHSAMDAPGWGTTSQQLLRIQDMHTQERGWADIGYHFLIDPSGEVWEGRALRAQGAHSGGSANVGNIGVCLLGNFDETTVPRSQLAALENLLDVLRRHFAVSASRVRTHREWKATECPGRFLQAAVDAYRSRASASLALQ